MRRLSVALIPGDGIGQEVVPAARKVLERAVAAKEITFAFEELDWSSDYYFRKGVMMPVNALDLLRAHDAILLGAVGHPDISDHITLNGLLLPIRRGFDLYANLRPAILYRGVDSPLRGYEAGQIDMAVVRENTEGEYAQVGGFLYHHQPEEVAIQTSVFTRNGVDRIVRFAFELARKRARAKKVTSVTKSNAQGFSMVLWDRVFRDVAAEYPDIQTDSLLVDAAAMNFVRRPDSFDVVVASNLFGDILSDISAVVTGSLGLAASANLDPTRRSPSLFEPVHGSAPDIAGRGIANPLAAILSAAMMMDHLGEPAVAESIEKAVEATLADGIRPADLGGTASTQTITQAVVDRLTY